MFTCFCCGFCLLFRFEGFDDKKVTELQGAASASRMQIRNLVVSNLVESCRRLAQFDADRSDKIQFSPDLEEVSNAEAINLDPEVELVRRRLLKCLAVVFRVIHEVVKPKSEYSLL